MPQHHRNTRPAAGPRARIERLVTTGNNLPAPENNVWLVGDDDEAVVIDAGRDASAVLAALGGRTLRAVVCTHAHGGHIAAAPALSAATGAPVRLHPADEALWKRTHPSFPPGRHLAEGEEIAVAGATLRVIHTPGHAPGAVCLYVPELGSVFTGDTLLNGGPGPTGGSSGDFATLITSIRDRLLTLPSRTAVLAGHGDSTLIEAEAKAIDELLAGPRLFPAAARPREAAQMS